MGGSKKIGSPLIIDYILRCVPRFFLRCFSLLLLMRAFGVISCGGFGVHEPGVSRNGREDPKKTFEQNMKDFTGKP